MSDKYIAEKLGLCWHEFKALDYMAIECVKCNSIWGGWHSFATGVETFHFKEGNPSPHFSQSVPLLKSEAKRAGLWETFLDWQNEEAIDFITKQIEHPPWAWTLPVRHHILWIYAEAEILTDPALCAQAFEAFLKESRGDESS